MVDRVKVLIYEKNGSELAFQEELLLDADNVFFDNLTNGFTSDNVQDAIEEVVVTNSNAASPGYSFGRSGNVSSNTWLLRPGNVPSNKTGVNFGFDNGSLDKVTTGSENLDTYTLEIYQHDGDMINLTLIATITVTSSRKEVMEKTTDYTEVSTPQKNRQLAIKLATGSAKNIGVDIELSGTK